MTCHASLSSLCIGGEATVMYLDAVDKGTPLCGPCIAAATRLGMNPKADRRAVQRIPEWRKRSLAKDMTWRSVA